MRICLVASIFLAVCSASLHASEPNAVYGEDNRFEAYERPHLKAQTQAIAAMIDNKYFTIETYLGYQIEAYDAQQTYNLCYGEKFEDQPILANCTGFLVAPDVLMTAAHCVSDAGDCRSAQWVFDFEMNKFTGAPKEIDRNNVFKCLSIISLSTTKGVDYSVIRLDRPTNRTPLRLASPEVIPGQGSGVYMIGHPIGLPMKVTEGGEILRNVRHLHVTNLDAFRGNSGAPVFDQATNTVIGILSSGVEDFALTPRGCKVSNALQMHQGQENVTSIRIVPRNY